MHAIRKSLLASAAGAAMLALVSPPAHADNINITINPQAGGLTTTSASFSTSGWDLQNNAVITVNTNNGTWSETGNFWVTSFVNPNSTGNVSNDGGLITNTAGPIPGDYGIFGTYTSTGKITSSTPGVESGPVNSLDFTVYGDVGAGPSGGAVNAAGTGVNANNANGGTVLELFNGELISQNGATVDTIGSTTIVTLSAVDNLSVCTNSGDGTIATNDNSGCSSNETGFFVTPPDPVDMMGVGVFNDSTGGVTAVAGASGITYYDIKGAVTEVQFVNVPEPASLTLFGAALLGLGAVLRRRPRKA